MTDSFTITDTLLSNGVVSWVPKEDDTPETVETSYPAPSVTVNNIRAGRLGKPAHYEVTFQPRVTFDFNGVEGTAYISVSCIVPANTDNAGYREIEATAADFLPEMMRQIASSLETLIEDAKTKNPQGIVP